jgi:flagellar assembly protein FliH
MDKGTLPHPSPVLDAGADFTPMPTPDQLVRPGSGDKLDTVPFEFADIRALAQRILKRATEKGQATMAAAQKQVAAMEKAAYDKAYADASEKALAEGAAKGEKAGMEQAEKRIQAAIESEKESLRQNAAPVTTVLEQLAGALDASRQQLIAQAEGDLLLLALDIAKRLVNHEISVDPEAIKPLALECIGLVTDRTSITAQVNPADFEVMQDFIPELKKAFPNMGALRIVPDESIERGGLMAMTREAEVDMRLATRLAAFEEAILGFSGEAAVAPWSRIPEEAIAAAKAANAESPYSLSDDHAEHTPEQTPGETPETVQPETTPVPDENHVPSLEEPAQTDMSDLADLAELADLVKQPPPPDQRYKERDP